MFIILGAPLLASLSPAQPLPAPPKVMYLFANASGSAQLNPPSLRAAHPYVNDFGAPPLASPNPAQPSSAVALKGHRSVGGMRASIYNAMPFAGVEALVCFMKDFADMSIV